MQALLTSAHWVEFWLMLVVLGQLLTQLCAVIKWCHMNIMVSDIIWLDQLFKSFPDSKVHGANIGPTWVLSDPDGPHVGPMNLAIKVVLVNKDNIKAPHYLALCVSGNHQWPLDSPHKGPVMWKALSCHDVIIIVVWVERIRALLTMLTMLNHFSITAHQNNNLICNFYLMLTYHFDCHIHCPLEINRECNAHTCPWALWYSRVNGVIGISAGSPCSRMIGSHRRLMFAGIR